MDITINKLIDLLNEDLELEYTTAIQFTNHAAIMSGAQYANIIRELENYACDNILHAVILSNQINCLGGKPCVNPRTVPALADSREMIECDIRSQAEAINRYELRIKQAEYLQLFLLAEHLKDILAREKIHALDKIKIFEK